MSQKQKPLVGPFSDKEKAAFQYIGVDPTHERYGGVLPEVEILEAILKATQTVSQSKYDFFKSLCDGGAITKKELNAVAPFFEAEAFVSYSATVLADAHALAETLVERVVHEQERYKVHWDLLEKEEALVVRHNATLFRLMNPKRSGRKVH